MIVFDLSCADGHRFEGWFASSDDFAAQHARGLVECPRCGSQQVAKAPMAPAVPKKGNQRGETKHAVANAPMPAEVAEALHHLAQAQAKALEGSRWVGDEFAEQSRAMHYGERDTEVIHGRATPTEAKELREEGVPVAPLPFPVAAPSDLN
jgi:hypothetical protein